ncbi:EDSAP-1 family PEP-CTERM protein [Paludisphaera sp.]|uniref:EDSAP-1 family PEP-CTERM protein n=1 Tax=Paludisphaera sp. TaxID=2017432 RepID=UPI00301C7D2E
MISSLRSLPTRLVTPVALAMGLVAAGVPETRADVYAYSRQTLSDLVVGGTTVSSLTTSTQDSATLNGSGPANSDPTDAPQAFVGAGALNPGENVFTQAGALGSPTFARGDVLWAGAAGGASTVAEGSVINTASASASASYTLTAEFSLAADGAVDLSFDFENSAIVQFLGSYLGLAAADFNSNLTIIITDSSGAVVFDESPDELNTSLSLTAAGSLSDGTSGTFTFDVGTLVAGDYTATLSGSSEIALRQAVPEPSSVILMGCGVMAAVGFGVRRARRARVEA